MRLRNLLFVLLLCMTVGVFSACTGDDGAQGPPGPQGPQGEQGPPGEAGMDGEDGEDFTPTGPTSEEGCEEFVERIRFDGTSGDDIICGNARGNVIRGEEGDDTVFGKEGNDRLYGNDGDDVLHGGPGDDTLRGNEDDDDLNGDAGKDDLHGGAGDDVMDGGEGDDTLWSFGATDGSDDFIGGDGTDVVSFGEMDLNGDGGGTDNGLCDSGNAEIGVTVSLLTGYTEFEGADGEIEVTDYYDGIENLTGTCGVDSLTGDTGDNVIRGGTGNDALHGGDGDDVIYPGADQGTPNTETGAGVLSGGKGMDTLVVYAADNNLELAVGSDFENLQGDGENNQLTGNAGPNVLNGLAGTDTLNGAGGDDIYVIGYGQGADTITLIYTVTEKDKVQLKGFPAEKRVLTEVTADGANIQVDGETVLTLSTTPESTATVTIIDSKSSIFEFVD